jgi:hypothetical protein
LSMRQMFLVVCLVWKTAECRDQASMQLQAAY